MIQNWEKYSKWWPGQMASEVILQLITALLDAGAFIDSNWNPLPPSSSP